MRHPLISLLVRWTVLALGVALSAHIVPGIAYRDVETLVVVVIILSFFNAFLKPLLLLFSLPFILLSLGLGVWIINALLIYLASRLVDGFYVHDFWAALWGALIVSVTNFIITRLLSRRTAQAKPRKPDDVIDI